MSRIRPFINNELIKVLTGFRRSGKSVMLDLIKQELIAQGVRRDQFISYNFEQMKYAHLLDAQVLYDDLQERISHIDGEAYLFFDEIQEVEQWERCINSCRVDFDCDIYVTGSNAHLLSSELATYLAGRYVEFDIYPFSFAEFLDALAQSGNPMSETEAFRKYVMLGGMPFLSRMVDDEDSSLQYLNDIYSSVVLKDIIARNNIRDVDLLERIIMYVLANVGHTFSGNTIAKYFKSEGRSVSRETVLNYVNACCDAFLLYKVKREDLVGKKILSVNEKYYVVDHALREAVYGYNERDIDQTLENIVYMELLRRGYTVTIGKAGQQEIDFVAAKNKQKIYVQVTYLLASEETAQREFGAFQPIADNFPRYVVSMDEFDMSRNGIKHKNIRDFLLMKSYE
ncbi:ATP-binding protein [Alloscardovia venturai]|uniref:ATP-binding protein n=1 Tax=Alloscardovia venturai TaxID=1769421 RepID=A0ABW2Y6E0_9BIFI